MIRLNTSALLLGSTVLLGGALVAGAVLASPPADARPFTADDLVSLDRLSDPRVSPDGSQVVFSERSTDLAANKGVNSVRLLSLTAGSAAPAVLAGAEAQALQPRWSADGHAIYVISGRGGSDQVWRLPVAGGPPVQVTHLAVDVGSFELSPDDRHLVVSLAVFPDTDSPDDTKARLDQRHAAKPTGVVYDTLFVRHWDTWADGTRNHLFALALDDAGVATGAAVPLMKGFDGDSPSKPFGDDSDYTIAPDGRTVFFSARLAGKSEPWSTNFDIYRTAIDGSGAPVDLTTANKAWDAGPVVSPDGRSLAYRAMKRPGFEADRYGVMVMDLASGTTHEIDPHWDRSPGTLLWSKDGRQLYVTAEELGQSKLFVLDATGPDSHPKALTDQGHVTEAELSGSDIVYQRDALDSPAQLWRIPSAGGTPVQLTHVDAGRLDGVEMAPVEQYSFTGWNNETVHGYVVKPDGYQAGHTYPVVFLVHGGPQGSFGNDWSYRWNPQFYSGLGYASVMVDFHGSTGYGQAFTDAISNHWGDRPLEDLQKGWKAALAKYPFLDASRACALGASYGGFMINWIAGSWNAPWKCLVTHDGVFDDRMMGFATEELWFAEWEHGGPGHTPWSDPAAYERFNPAAHVAAWRVPQLIIHGQHDYRIPIEQGLGAFDALQRRGVESRLLVFPDENHWVLKPANSLLWHATVADWLHAHIGN
ncbi:prolyl oligopeptidase family serine peptidase [Lichenicola sp.]|uniref:prolyl oligopeptidase family serine peptidase n=1 Tax=Lichenicola sp. TaxID=2804529 RepID=UPI003AFFED16